MPTSLSLNESIELATSHLNNGELQKAASLCNEILQANPDSTETLILFAEIAIKTNKLPAAIALYEEILKRQPSPNIYLKLGNLLQQTGNKSAAIDQYKNAIKLAPDYIDAHNNIAFTLMQMGQLDDAIRSFQNIININPQYIHAFYNLGVCSDKQKNPKTAKEWYKKALFIDASHNDSNTNLATIYLEQGDFASALAHYTKAISNNITSVYNYIACLHRIRDYDKAKQFIAAQSKLYPPEQTAGLHIILAQIEYENGNFTECKSALDMITLKENAFPNYEALHSYYKLLSGLIEYKHNLATSTNKLYLVGDSHCLSPAFSSIKMREVEYTCIPKLVMGAQARHFSSPGNNQFKQSFINTIESIPENSQAVLMFGEIDCRINYGILPYHYKTVNTSKSAIDNTIENIITGYVNFVTKKCSKKNLQIIFYGVPRSHVSLKFLPQEDSDLLNYVIAKFNSELASSAKKHMLPFIDIHSLQGDIHIDNNHLKPDALNHALQQL